MNFFYCDENLQLAAQALDDKRLNKMILETAQLLATAINESGGKATYKSTHKNHPVAKWTRNKKANYQYLLHYFGYLTYEYSLRFKKTHKCLDYLDEFLSGRGLFSHSYVAEQPPNCTIFKEELDTRKAYRDYLNYKWANDKREPKWTNRIKPSWANFEWNGE